MAPQRNPPPVPGTTPAIPNLIRRSIRSDSIASPAVGSRGSFVNSTADVSINGRSVSLARWNNHYLVPKAITTDDSSDPITTGFGGPNYWAPDWVIVTRSGPVAYNAWNSALADSNSTNNNYSIGRYAYVVYDEGGLLDFNVAAYPYPSPSPPVTTPALTTNIGRKGVIAFADLTGMRITPGGSTPNSNALTNMVAWRNYATIHASGAFPNLTSADPTASNFVTYVLITSRDFRTTDPTIYNNQTDQTLVSRKELIELVRSVGSSFNLLQFLGTFSRELNRPTWIGGSGIQLAARFPLSRFDLFANSPPSNPTDVQKYFGLKYIAAVGPPANIAEHWEYDGTSGSVRQASIPSIASSNQDPDLFSLLAYALPSSSVGELLSIGASLIDQRDQNDETTWIEYGDPSAPAQKAYGVDRNPAPSPAPRPASVVVLNRGFRNVGELGYGYRNASTNLDFHTAASSDAPLLDLFTYNTAPVRAGTVNLNTESSAILAAIIRSALPTEASTTGITTPQATPAATNIVKATITQPAIGRQDVARMASIPTNAPFSTGPEQRETITRSLAEVGQTRTWGLVIDVIAQSGRYSPTATNLSQFVVEGEKRYWLHIAIDRYTGQVIDQQLEGVYE